MPPLRASTCVSWVGSRYAFCARTFPPRLRRDQDIDFGCLSKGRKDVVAYLESAGCEPDRRFNSLNGDRQMYFNAPSGRPIDVMVDQLNMCHVLDFRPRFQAMPITLDVADLLLTKLQIIEMNEKDARDITPPTLRCRRLWNKRAIARGVDADRFVKVLGGDWGWWRTVTDNLVKLPKLLDEHPHLVPEPRRPITRGERRALSRTRARSAQVDAVEDAREGRRSHALVRAARRG